MRRLWLLSILPLFACMTPASRGAGTIVSASESPPSAWTDQEKTKDSVIRNLRESPEASFHVLRVQGELSLRIHRSSDLVLMVVAGQVELRLGDRTIPSAPGDVVEVPREVPYAIVNRGKEAAVLYAVYTPGFNPDDVKTISEPTGSGAWKFNLWTQ